MQKTAFGDATPLSTAASAEPQTSKSKYVRTQGRARTEECRRPDQKADRR